MANGQGMAGLSGAFGGAAQGAKLGTAIAPGVGTAIGAGAGALLGGITGANKKKKANEASDIARVAPMEQAPMAELNQITKNLSVGADSLTQNRLSELQKVGAQTQGAISKVSGGDVGSTVQGMLQAQRNTQKGVNTALADRGQLPYFQNLAQQLQTRMSQRKLELDKLKRDQLMAETAQSQTDSNLNANAYASALMGGDVNTIKQGLADAGINRDAMVAGGQGIKNFIGGIFNPQGNAAFTGMPENLGRFGVDTPQIDVESITIA